MSITSLHVRLHGQEYVWFKDENGSGALAYLDHVDEQGDLRFEHVCSESYAYVHDDGYIKRYGSVIGSVKDLEIQNLIERSLNDGG